MIEPDAVLEVADGVLNLGVAAIRPPVPECLRPGRDEAVIAVVGQEGQLRSVGCTRRTMSRTGAASRTLEGD